MMKRTKMVRDTSFSDQDQDDTNLVPSENEDTNEKKKSPNTIKKILTRAVAATILFCIYMLILFSGHLYCIAAVVLTQIELYREVVNIRYIAAKERSMPWFRTLQWAWFFVAMFLVYGETLHKFCVEHHQLVKLTQITRFIHPAVYIMYWVLFVASVLTLKPGMIRFQLSQHMFSIVTVCLVVFQCKFFAENTLNGLFWYLFPMATVIMNDCSAYFAGISFGKKFISAPFLALSPNKTWEGFIGAAIGTIFFSFFMPAFLAQFDWLICPADGLYLWPFPPPLTCEPNPVFIKTIINLPFVGPQSLYPIQLHGIAYGVFASVVAPFGGFFASALKRAYNKKDFDSFIPGHGGMMDRMDCQLLMATFTTFYYFAFIKGISHTVGKMLYLASLMTVENQELLWLELGKQLGKIV
eukprot:gene10077-13543_t